MSADQATSHVSPRAHTDPPSTPLKPGGQHELSVSLWAGGRSGGGDGWGWG
ncbi:hypothetical protein [Planktomarina sp.]|uniref:hypothetical protein n=1 Tax=Planktomarina sp. TaxID=2024851 RepID=UPI003260FF8A